MLICKLCDRECKSKISLGTHVKQAHKMNTQDYVVKTKYDGIHPTCNCGCGKETKYNKSNMDFNGLLRGHVTKDVIRKRQKSIKKTLNEKYGPEVNNPWQIPDVVDKIQKVRSEKMDEIVEKTQKTLEERYGVNCSWLVGYKDRPNPFSLKEVQDKIKATIEERYDVDNIAKSDYAKQRSKETITRNHGVATGVETKNCRDASNKQKKEQAWKTLVDACNEKGYEMLFSYDDYTTNKDMFDFRCIEHDRKFQSNLFRIQRLYNQQCSQCQHQGTSKNEREIQDFMTELVGKLIGENDSIIYPYQIDAYSPDHKVGVEHHGLLYHSQWWSELKNTKFDKKAHQRKFELCRNKNIKLLQFFEDEWNYKKDICKSMIRNSIGCSKKLNARDFDVAQITPQSSEEIRKFERSFVDNNHIQGYAQRSASFCLIDENEDIVSCLSIRIVRSDKTKKTIEIARFCSKLNCSVRGGFSRLLKYAKQWAKEQGYEKIITYSDCRFGFGEVYKNNGFDFVHHTGLNYWQTDKDFRYSREKFRADKERDMSERQVIEEADVRPIYGAGNYLWELGL